MLHVYQGCIFYSCDLFISQFWVSQIILAGYNTEVGRSQNLWYILHANIRCLKQHHFFLQLKKMWSFFVHSINYSKQRKINKKGFVWKMFLSKRKTQCAWKLQTVKHAFVKFYLSCFKKNPIINASGISISR